MWVTCNVCSKAVNAPKLDLVAVGDPAPCCGGTGIRTMWPSHRYKGPLDLLRKLDFETEDGARTGCLFLSAFLESLLEDALWNMLQRNVPANVVLTVMDRVDGRDKALNVYKRLVGKSAAQVLEGEGLGAWYQDWQELVLARNDLAHGAWQTRPLKKALPVLVNGVRQGSLQAMAMLRNAGVDAMKAQSTHVLIDDVPDD